MKQSLSYKSYIRHSISISKKGEILKTESKAEEALTDFLQIIVKNLIISQARNQEIFTGNRVFFKLGHFHKDSRTARARKDPQGKNIRFFGLETLKNCILNEEFYP